MAGLLHRTTPADQGDGLHDEGADGPGVADGAEDGWLGEGSIPPELRQLLRACGGWLLGWTVLVTLLLIGYGSAYDDPPALSVLAHGALSASAAFGGGLVLGLLFGIPRAAAQTDSDTAAYRANTNLEQVSDWVTKIIIGITLTQFREIAAAGGRLVDTVAEGFEGRRGAAALAGALIASNAVLGFLLCYLVSRTVLPWWFQLAQRRAVRSRAQLQQVEAEAKSEAAAARSTPDLVIRQLDPRSPEVPTGELSEALRRAPGPVRVQAFSLARRLRRQAERELAARPGVDPAETGSPDNETVLRRALTVFEALAAVDVDERFHRNHAQIAYCLMALPAHTADDLTTAIRELTEAIKIRDARRVRNWRIYELRRAQARIMLSRIVPALASDATVEEWVREDLTVAAREPLLRDMIQSEAEFDAWRSGDRAREIGLSP